MRTTDSPEERRQGSDEGPIINIVGDNVALGPLRSDLIPLYQRWVNDFRVLRTLHIPRPTTLEEARAGFDADLAAERERRIVNFTVYDRATMLPIGRTDLMGINYRDGRADFGIVIGETAYHGRGYGTETTRLMLDYAFTGLGLHSVALETWEYNLAGRRAYAKAGFRESGRRRQAKFMGGKFWDIVIMDCLATEYVSPWLRRVMVPDAPRPPAEG